MKANRHLFEFSITKPLFTNFAELDNCLTADDEVLVVSGSKEVKLYPKRILSYHLLVNDTLEGKPILVTRCNLCNSYQVYNRTYKGESLVFGISGKLYKNNDLMFDHKTESLWSQFDGKARIGIFTDAKLAEMKFQVLSYATAKELYPAGKILSFDTGFRRNYAIDSFSGFENSEELIAPSNNSNPVLPSKEMIVGFQIEDQDYAVAISSFENAPFVSKAAGQIIRIYYDDAGEIVALYDGEEGQIKLTKSYWYVWYDFYPTTTLLTSTNT